MSAPRSASGSLRPARGNTRKIIVGEAARLFALKGYEGASVGDIALATGISKPAIYHHFADKDQIYSEVVGAVLRDMLDNAARSLDGIASPAERLRVFMLAHAAFFEQHRHSYIAAHLGFRGLRSRGRDAALRLRDDYEGMLRDILADAQRAGALDVPDVPAAGRMILSTLNWMARWYQPDGPQTAREIAARYADMLLQGLLPRGTAAGEPRAAGRVRRCRKRGAA